MAALPTSASEASQSKSGRPAFHDFAPFVIAKADAGSGQAASGLNLADTLPTAMGIAISRGKVNLGSMELPTKMSRSCQLAALAEAESRRTLSYSD